MPDLGIIPYRFRECTATLPILYTEGKITVACLGPHADLMAIEALRWPDVEKIYVLKEIEFPAEDKRAQSHIEVVKKLEDDSCDVVLLSPNQDPSFFFSALRDGGIMCVSTTELSKIGALRSTMFEALGNVIMWREYLPRPIYGVLSHKGSGKPKLQRKIPNSTERLNDRYMKCLFTFGKDEIPFLLGRPQRKVTARG